MYLEKMQQKYVKLTEEVWADRYSSSSQDGWGDSEGHRVERDGQTNLIQDKWWSGLRMSWAHADVETSGIAEENGLFIWSKETVCCLFKIIFLKTGWWEPWQKALQDTQEKWGKLGLFRNFPVWNLHKRP